MTLDLLEVKGIGKSIAEKMKASGIDTVEKLASTKIQGLLKVNGIGESTGKKYIKSAKNLLQEKKEFEKKEISEKNVVSKEKELYEAKKYPTYKHRYKSIPHKNQRPIKKRPQKKKVVTKRKKSPVKTFFPAETIQRIRFFHFKIKHLEKALERANEDLKLDDLNLILDYVLILNVNYKTQSQIKIFKELNITPNFYDPLENRDIKIWDLMYECTRVLWILARTYAYLSEKFEAEKKLKNAIIAMDECSKAYKTAAYFSTACIRQEDMGLSLSSETLELNSEETRISAQKIATEREENKANLFLASQMYAGLSALSKRFYFLKNHEKIKQQQIKAQIEYDIGKACYLKAKALLKSSIALENEEKIKKIKQKSNYYFSRAEEIWEKLLKKTDDLSKEELKNLRFNLSIVNENIIENDVEILDYKDIKNIQNPEPFIAVPENIGLFLPRSTMYLTRYRTRDLNYERYKEYKISKLELNPQHGKMEKLLNRKAGIGRTIQQLRSLYDRNDIDINTFFELLEQYTIKLEMIESTIKKLRKKDKPIEVDKKRTKQQIVSI